MGNVNTEILETLKKIETELVDFKLIFQKQVFKQSFQDMQEADEDAARKHMQAEESQDVWYLVATFYREHRKVKTANEFVEKAAELQKLYPKTTWERAWKIWCDDWAKEDES